MLGVILLTFSIGSWFALVSIGSLLEMATEKHAMDGTLQKIPGKAGVSSLFKKSLQFVKWRELNIVDTSVQWVLSHIHAQQPTCAQSNYISKSDIINILYYTASYGNIWKTFIPFAGNNTSYLRDVSFRRLIDQTIAADVNIKQPTVTDKNVSCMKLIQCHTNSTWVANTQLTLQHQIRCENTVRQSYVDQMFTHRSYSLLTDNTFGENLFQNGSLADSDYDLMVDIYNIGRIMFQGYQAPVELVYYQFPTPAQAWGSTQIQQLWSNLGGFWSAGVQTWPQAGPSIFPLTPAGMPSQWFLNVGWVIMPDISPNQSTETINQNNPIDDQFIQNTNTSTLPPIPVATSPDIIIGANVCIVPTDPIPAAADYIAATISFEEYQLLLDEYYDLLQESDIINNLISDAIAIVPSNVFDPTDPASINAYTQEIAIIEQEIAQTVDTIFDLNIKPDDPAIQSCIDDCNGLSVVDYAICTAKCLCGEWGSAAQAINGFEIIQKDAFKVRFCQVPPSATPVTKWRSIYSIEEIFQEMKNIFVSLRDSWELFKHVRTKEFLDSSIKKNNFWKMFSFNIFITTKAIKDNTPATQYKEQLEISNKKLEAKLLNQANTMAPMTERNKYIMIDNPAMRKVSQEANDNISDLIRRIEETQSLTIKASWLFSNIDTDMQVQKTAIINNEIQSFFKNNFQFWDAVTQKFMDFNGIAENLKNKTQKAK
jgi:hypothetical protein